MAILSAVLALVAIPCTGQASQAVIGVAVESRDALLPAATAQGALESALADVPAFATLKRRQLSALLEERSLSIADLSSAPSPDVSGVIDYLLFGQVVDASVASKLSPLGSLLRVLGSGGDCTASVRMEFDVVDLRTGDSALHARVTRREPVKVVFPPGADYSRPCEHANRSRKWRALEAATEDAATQIARQVTLALFPARLIRVGESEVTLNYGGTILSVGDQLKVLSTDGGAHRGTSVTGQTVVGHIAVSAVSPRRAVADVIHASQPFTTGARAVVLDKDERRQLDRMVAAMARKAARQERACENARKKVRRYCGRDPESRRCKDAEAAVSTNCGD